MTDLQGETKLNFHNITFVVNTPKSTFADITSPPGDQLNISPAHQLSSVGVQTGGHRRPIQSNPTITLRWNRGLIVGSPISLSLGLKKKNKRKNKRQENEKQRRKLGGTKDWKHFLLPLDTKKRTRRLEGQIINKKQKSQRK